MDVAGSRLQYHLTDLREFTEYSFHVSAFNQNGEGGYSEEVSISQSEAFTLNIDQ